MNNDCSDVFEGATPEGQERTHGAASNKVNRAKLLIVNVILLFGLVSKTLQRRAFFRQSPLSINFNFYRS